MKYLFFFNIFFITYFSHCSTSHGIAISPSEHTPQPFFIATRSCTIEQLMQQIEVYNLEQKERQQTLQRVRKQLEKNLKQNVLYPYSIFHSTKKKISPKKFCKKMGWEYKKMFLFIKGTKKRSVQAQEFLKKQLYPEPFSAREERKIKKVGKCKSIYFEPEDVAKTSPEDLLMENFIKNKELLNTLIPEQESQINLINHALNIIKGNYAQ